jgi:hypothetical protein
MTDYYEDLKATKRLMGALKRRDVGCQKRTIVFTWTLQKRSVQIVSQTLSDAIPCNAALKCNLIALMHPVREIVECVVRPLIQPSVTRMTMPITGLVFIKSLPLVAKSLLQVGSPP